MSKLFETPTFGKQIFKDFIFPCQQNKAPAIGESWKTWRGNTEDITLAGLDCGKAGLVVVDFDFYKSEFKKDRNALAFYHQVKIKSKFMQKTKSGGEHYFFRRPEDRKIGCMNPFIGVDIKGIGGYVCIYNVPFHQGANFETFSEFYKALPVFDFQIKGKPLANVHSSEWAKGNRNNTLNTKLYRVLSMGDWTGARNVLDEAEKAGLSHKEICRTAKSVVASGITPVIPINRTQPKPEPKLKNSIKDFTEITGAESNWIIPDWIPEYGTVLLTADKGGRKTTTGFYLCRSLMSKDSIPLIKKTKGLNGRLLYCWIDGQDTTHKKRLESYDFDLKRVSSWEYDPRNKKTDWSNLLNIEKEIKQGIEKKNPYSIVFIDRIDLCVRGNKQKQDIVDTNKMLELFANKYKVLFLMTRHTSKPQGQDIRKFKDRTDGFKDWQHGPRVCLMIHATRDEAYVFKQYINEAPNSGLLSFTYHTHSNGKQFFKLAGYDETISQDEIEAKLNPKGAKDSLISKSDLIYSIFKEKGQRCKERGIEAYALTKTQIYGYANEKELAQTTTYRTMIQKLGAFYDSSGGNKKYGTMWFCPIKKSDL